MLEMAESREDLSLLLSEEDESVAFEVDAILSEKVLHSSCSHHNQACCTVATSNSPGSDCESIQDDKNPKTRKFKNIALPNWLVKPSTKRSSEERHFVKHFPVFYNNKKKMLRANSAPKKLGTGINSVKVEYKSCSTIDEAKEDSSLQEIQQNTTKRPKSPGVLSKQNSEDQGKGKGTVWRRRASLPAHVGQMLSDGLEINTRSHTPLTPEAHRKEYHNPTGKMEKDVLKTLIFGGSETNKIPCQKVIYDKKHQMIDSNNNASKSISKNSKGHKLEVPRLQLHRLETPDLFYVPDFDEDSTDTASRLDKVVSVSTGELQTATKIDNEKLEVELIKSLMSQELKNYLDKKEFIPDLSQTWCSDLSQAIKNSVQSFKGSNYKVIAVVYIAAIRDNGVHAAIQCIWTPEDDCFTTASYANDDLFAFASIMAIKYD